MGLVLDAVEFDGPAPDLQRIVAKVTEMTGLPLTFKDSDAEIKANLYDLHATVAITGVASTQLELSSYRTGAVKAFADDAFGETGNPVVPFIQGYAEPPGTQTVLLRSYVGLEPTLFYAVLFALEGLGGRLSHPMTDEHRREYGGPTTVAEVRARERKQGRQMTAVMLLGCLILPVMLPIWI